jgi:hypothetical protein
MCTFVSESIVFNLKENDEIKNVLDFIYRQFVNFGLC